MWLATKIELPKITEMFPIIQLTILGMKKQAKVYIYLQFIGVFEEIKKFNY